MAFTSGLLRIAAVMTGIARFGSAAHSGGEFDLDDVGAGFLERLDGRDLPDRAIALVEGAEHDDRVARRQACILERPHAKGGTLRLELGTDVAAAEGRHDLGDRHVLVHHLDAVLRGLFGQRHDRGIARVAHHRDASRLGGDRLAELLHHLLHRPAREDVVDVSAGVGSRLPRAVVDDSAEGVTLGPAHEEAQLHVLAPVLAQRLRVGSARNREQRRGGQNTGREHLGSHVDSPLVVIQAVARGCAACGSGTKSAPPRHSLR